MRAIPTVLALLTLLACGSSDDAGDTVATVSRSDDPRRSIEPSRPVTTTPPRPASTVRGSAIDPALQLVVAAREDLAARLGVGTESVTVVDARAVTWGDSSYGCPEPGMRYLSQLIEGALVVLEADGRRFEYHGGDPLFLCE